MNAQLHRWPAWIGPMDARKVDEIEVVASVLVAILFAHLLRAPYVAWAAYSGYMVMRGHAGETLRRGVLRIAGTAAGAALALAAMPLLRLGWPIEPIALAVVGTGSLYRAITARRAYAWLFFGLTFVMVVLDSMTQPGAAVPGFVRDRILEVVAGTSACVLISLASTLTLRRRWPARQVPPPVAIGWHRHAFRHAAQGGAALAVLMLIAGTWAVPAVSQSAITIMAVMILPATAIGPSGLGPVSRRLLYRFLGCIAGAALAAAVLFAASGSAPLLVLGTVAGVAFGRHLENGGRPTAYVGTQFVLAVLIILVPDSYADAQIAPGLERLAGVAIGMAVLEPVLVLWHLVRPDRRRVRGAAAGEPGGV
jgi:uncharacterized membrane protein YccC